MKHAKKFLKTLYALLCLFVSGKNNVFVFHFKNSAPDNLQFQEIWYASLEGPEAAAYERGTAQLENGETFVELSEHFQLVAKPETMTVIVTPLSADTYGLAVVEKTATGFRVKEVKNGSGNFEFDWEVKCVRKGFENYRPVRDKVVLWKR